MISRNLRNACLVAVALCLISAVRANADTYKVDPVHSSALFRIKHMNVSMVYGRFNDPSGTIDFDEADPTKTAFNLEIQVANVDTHNAQRDEHLRSDTFFSAKQFPTITFKSTSAKKTGDKTVDVTGDLTLHGVTKSVTIPFTLVGAGPGMKKEPLVGYMAEFDVKRSEYGMDQMLQGVGDDVHIMISMEANKK